jgi:hypothetical protein
MKIKTIVAFLVSPLVIPAVMVLCVLLVPRMPLTMAGSQPFTVRIREGLSLGMLALWVAYGVVILGAVPGHFRLARWRRTEWWAYATLGAVLGTVPWLLFAAFVYVFDFSMRDFPPGVLATFIWLGIACGIPAALLFWLIEFHHKRH